MDTDVKYGHVSGCNNEEVWYGCKACWCLMWCLLKLLDGELKRRLRSDIKGSGVGRPSSCIKQICEQRDLHEGKNFRWDRKFIYAKLECVKRGMWCFEIITKCGALIQNDQITKTTIQYTVSCIEE